ncbi:DUF177 domain-containing protein [Amylibacter sp. IMCC11727]|uniref:YceD family protein n=1 Tax=Amylibacter sp. IMCC11727 TaxID=3039851 RepID=UPI00244E2E4E|nr:DUF177 domain-containing protein [Amylibacter sp. IMCC11727]WGI20734.1 DUF177 domain-containing protein [Amylibacter sp. IMCC11727]
MASSAKQPKRKITEPVLMVADMPSGREISFEITFDDDQKAQTVEQLALLELHKLRFAGKITPQGKSDWSLDGELGATATQACVVTLDPVKTRVDEPVSRSFLARWEEPEADSISEMDEDVESEPLGDQIDLAAIAVEALALALPDYPRKSDVALEEAVFSEPGVKPMTDDDAKPFAGLAALKEKLEKGE